MYLSCHAKLKVFYLHSAETIWKKTLRNPVVLIFPVVDLFKWAWCVGEQCLNLTDCYAVQNRRMELEGEQGELKINKKSPVWQRRPPRLPWAPVKAWYIYRRQPCALAFYRDSGFIPAAATLTAARTAKVAWTQSCCRTPGTAGPTDRHTPAHTHTHKHTKPEAFRMGCRWSEKVTAHT